MKTVRRAALKIGWRSAAECIASSAKKRQGKLKAPLL